MNCVQGSFIIDQPSLFGKPRSCGSPNFQHRTRIREITIQCGMEIRELFAVWKVSADEDFRRSLMQQDPSVRFLKKASMCSILMAAKMSFHESQNVISPLDCQLSRLLAKMLVMLLAKLYSYICCYLHCYIRPGLGWLAGLLAGWMLAGSARWLAGSLVIKSKLGEPS